MRYRVMSLLSADRACAHLAAIETRDNTRVDVQILLAMDDSIDAVHLRFLADARKAAALDEPHTERILHVGVTSDGHPFVVKEALAGQTLAKLLEQIGSLDTESAVDVAIAICEALESAHAHGLVHGALQTNDIHLSWADGGPSGVKVAGLGAARALAMLPLDARALTNLATRAPELLQSDREIDARADVWGVGVLLYTMLAGAPPFGADSPSTLDLAMASDEPAMLAGVPDGLAEVVDACLSRDPALRLSTAAALASKLAPFGSRPVFTKKPSLLVVDTGAYKALELERLVEEAAPGSEPSVDVEISVVEVIPPEPTARVVAPSVPPVSFSVVPAAIPQASRPRGNGRLIAIFAAAGVAMAITAGALSMRVSSSSPSAASDLPPRAQEQPLAVAVFDSPAAAAAPSPALTPAFAVGDLPASNTAGPLRARGAAPKARASAAPVAAAPAATAPAAAAAPPAAEPIVPAAAAPIQPQPKASDDDLRRFLDDRR